MLPLCLSAVLAAAPPPSSLRFFPPEGWVDLSRDAPRENFERAPPGILEVAHSAQITFYATDLRPSADGIYSNMNVVLEPAVEPINEASIARVADGLDRDVKARDPSFVYRLIDKRIIELGGVRCGRVEGEFALGAVKVRQLMYLAPSGGVRATVTYSASPALYDRLVPLFEANMARVQGLVEPAPPADDGPPLAAIVAIGGAATVLTAWGLVRRRRRKLSVGSGS